MAKRYENNCKKENIYENVKSYQKNKRKYIRIYENWEPQRRTTLSELRNLKSEVNKDEKDYKETQIMFKNLSHSSREFKSDNPQAGDFVSFLASATAMFSDAVGGISSIGQVIKTDEFLKKLNDILAHDKEITKPLYVAKSKCSTSYSDVEVVMRDYYVNTWGSTVDKITETFSGQKQKKSANSLQGFINDIGNIVGDSNPDNSIENVFDLLDTYVKNNPAVLNACTSISKAVVEATDTWKLYNSEKTNPRINRMIARSDTWELNRYRNSDESELEKKLDNAIRDLEFELGEFRDVYYKLKGSIDDYAAKPLYENYDLEFPDL